MTGGLNRVMKLKTDLSDNELLRSMLAGDEEALALLYRRRQGGVYRFALQMSGSKSIAEDVTQEVFLFLMRDGHVFDPTRGSLSAFLFGVTRNYVLRRLRVEQLLAPLNDESDEDIPLLHATADLCPLEDLTRAETIESVRKSWCCASFRMSVMARRQRFWVARLALSVRVCTGRERSCSPS